jgi:fimbrial chaperone protein
MRSLRLVLTMVFLFSSVSFSYAGAVEVVPTKLFLTGGKKTEVLKVTNKGDEKVTIQVEAVKWVQGEEGKDIFEPTKDIVFFPKIFTIESGKEWLLRIGSKEPRIGDKEMSYRVFLQEIPVSKPGESQLTLALRLSVPVFIKPVKERTEWTIEKAEFSEDRLEIKIKNTGNSHIIIGKLKAKGLDASNQETFRKDAAGWYVLPGVVRAFPMEISAKDCLNSAVIEVGAEVGDSHKELKLNLDKTLCPEEEEPADKAKKKEQ